MPRHVVHYLAVFLTENSRALLLRAFPPLHPTVTADHITVVVRPEDDQILTFPFGWTTRVTVVGVAADNKGQAAAVEVVGLPLGNKLPHVTISCAEGVSPSYSNELLARGPITRVKKLHLTGHAGWFDGSKPWFTNPLG